MTKLNLILSSILLLLLHMVTPLQAATDGRLLDSVVAVVENDVITQNELDDRVLIIKRQFTGDPDQLPPSNILRKQVLERMIIERLQLNLADQQGISVDEITLDESMRTIAQNNGLSLESFRDAMVAEGIDYVNFREQVRNELIITNLRKRVINTQVQVTDQEVEDFLANNIEAVKSEQEVRLRHILIAIPEAAGPDEIAKAEKEADALRERALTGEDFTRLAVSASDGQKALEGGDLGWRSIAEIPSLFTRHVSTMKKGDISQVIRSPSGFHIVQIADQRGGERAMVNQTRARHILIKTTAIVDDEEARTRLSNLRSRIQQGEDFEELARANSDDKGSAVNGGNLGWTSPGNFVPQFEEVMNSMDKGELSEPFKSNFGWHILEVTGRREHDSTSELQQSQALQFIRERKAEEETEIWLRRLLDQSYVEYRIGSESG